MRYFELKKHTKGNGDAEYHLFGADCSNGKKNLIFGLLPNCGRKNLKLDVVLSLPSIKEGLDYYEELKTKYEVGCGNRKIEKCALNESDMRIAIAIMQNNGYDICGVCTATLYATNNEKSKATKTV